MKTPLMPEIYVNLRRAHLFCILQVNSKCVHNHRETKESLFLDRNKSSLVKLPDVKPNVIISFLFCTFATDKKLITTWNTNEFVLNKLAASHESITVLRATS